MATIEEINEAKEELKKVKESCDKSIEKLVRTSKKRAITFVMEAIVGGCAMVVVEKISGKYLPKNLTGISKISAASLCFILPEILAAYAGNVTEKILEE